MKQNDNPRCVYGLVDRFTGELRYIGQTKHRPSRRLRQHVNNAVSIVECEKDWWICKHLIRGVDPMIVVLARPRGFLLRTEMRLIAKATKLGIPLLNREWGKRVERKYHNQFYSHHRAVRDVVFPIALYGYSMSQAIRDYRRRN